MIEEAIKGRLLAAGAVAVGIAAAGPVSEAEMARYEAWLASGSAAGMGYMHRHLEIRRDPRLLLEGARSMVCMAFSYASEAERDCTLPRIAAYALLPDYHDWVREAIRGSGVGDLLGAEGSDWRICVDSAPVMERYWAVEAGIGYAGDNGSVIVPGVGSKVILAEIVTRSLLEPDRPLAEECLHCGLCRCEARSASGLDCNRCVSYLTIEHRGPWTDPEHLSAMQGENGRGVLFGCDRCIETCPLNRASLGHPAIVAPIEGVVGLSLDDVLSLPPEGLKRRLKGTALARAKAEGLKRNATRD